MKIPVQDILDRVSDHLGSYDTGQSNEAQRLRAIESADNYISERISFWNRHKISMFSYTQDKSYYDLEDDFLESIRLAYLTESLNNPSNRWAYKNYTDILLTNGLSNNQYGVTFINGKVQLLMKGRNSKGGTIYDTFDSVLWTAVDDASNVAFDTNIKTQGAASQRFSITRVLGDAILKKTGVAFDASAFHSLEGAWRLDVFMDSVDFSEVRFRYMTDDTNYFQISTNVTVDGSEFIEGAWNKLSFESTDKTIVGSPVETNLTRLEIEFITNPGFTAVNSMRVDNLYTVYPDKMQIVYASSIKGVDKDNQPIKRITAKTDSIEADYSYMEALALHAALYCNPQLRADKEWQMMYKQNVEEWIKLIARKYPRMRTQNNTIETRLRR